ncbi:MAG: exopolyphosphatase [Micrococcales bacterium]|nr:exopolyphosphatase [Micrococcales bacterium]
MLRAAGIDCGTNSIRLLVADVDLASGSLTDVARLMEVVRLGQGVDQTGWFAPDALERTLVQVERFGRLCRELEVGPVRFVATSATRDAANRNILLDAVRAELGVEVDVVSGLEEAHLSFTGALSGAAGRRPGPKLCVDIGGGSTELSMGTVLPEQSYSIDLGCVRVTERYLRSDPPIEAELWAASAEIEAALDAAEQAIDLGQTAHLVGLAGSVTTVTAMALGLDHYDPALIDGAELPVPKVLEACQSLWQASRAERARLGFMHPGRVDVIGAGALIWALMIKRVANAVERQGGSLTWVLTSEHDILDGITLSAAGYQPS